MNRVILKFTSSCWKQKHLNYFQRFSTCMNPMSSMKNNEKKVEKDPVTPETHHVVSKPGASNTLRERRENSADEDQHTSSSTAETWWTSLLAWLKKNFAAVSVLSMIPITISFLQWDFIKFQQQVRTLMNSTIEPTLPQNYIPREDLEKELLEKSDKLCILVVGPKGCGKSTLVENALRGRKGVVNVEINSSKDLFEQLEEQYVTFEHLKACKARGQEITLNLIYRHGSDVVVTLKDVIKFFGRPVQYDKKVGKVIIQTSESNDAVQIPVDDSRWDRFWVGDFSKEQAIRYLKGCTKVQESGEVPLFNHEEINLIVDKLGSRPVHLKTFVSKKKEKDGLEEEYIRKKETVIRGDLTEAIVQKKVKKLVELLVKSDAHKLHFNEVRSVVGWNREEFFRMNKKYHLFQVLDTMDVMFFDRVTERIAEEYVKQEETRGGGTEKLVDSL